MPSLMILFTLLLVFGLTKPVLAATITISDQASCEAIGGIWFPPVVNPGFCGRIPDITIAANSTLQIQIYTQFDSLTNNGAIEAPASFSSGDLFVNAGATLNAQGELSFGVVQNAGDINFTQSMKVAHPSTNLSTGQIHVRSGATLYLYQFGNLTNAGTITVDCGGQISYSDGVTISGNPPKYTDCSPPTANPSQSPAANANGWTDSDVTVFWNWSDNTGGSGLDLTHCTTNSKSSGEGVQTLTATCQDKAGNVGSASYTVKVDKTAPVANPVQSPVATASGWTTSQNVTVNWNWTDPSTGSGTGSGLDSANCTTSSNSGTDLGIITLDAFCFDQLGNSGVASYTLKIDPFAPLISRTRNPGPNGAGWNNSAVAVSFGCNDGNFSSGVASNTLAGATLSNEGANQSV